MFLHLKWKIQSQEALTNKSLTYTNIESSLLYVLIKGAKLVVPFLLSKMEALRNFYSMEHQNLVCLLNV